MYQLDRTSELRRKGYVGRRLGPKQMTTDTAVRVTRLVAQAKGWRFLAKSRELEFLFSACAHTCAVPLAQIPWVDFPELRLGEHESVEMPFRYVKGADGQPVMPEVSVS